MLDSFRHQCHVSSAHNQRSMPTVWMTYRFPDGMIPNMVVRPNIDVDVPSPQKIRFNSSTFFWRSADPRRYANKVAKTHVQRNVQVGADQDLLALEVGIGQIGHSLLAGRHGWYKEQVRRGGKMRRGVVASSAPSKIRDATCMQRLLYLKPYVRVRIRNRRLLFRLRAKERRYWGEGRYHTSYTYVVIHC